MKEFLEHSIPILVLLVIAVAVVYVGLFVGNWTYRYVRGYNNTYDLDRQRKQMERERRKQLKQLRKENTHLNEKGQRYE